MTMTGPLARAVDPRLPHAPQFNAKSHINRCAQADRLCYGDEKSAPLVAVAVSMAMKKSPLVAG